ncbi:hypothetical protein PAN31108_03675 [Pandoraea anhela]|uniref:Uncharacterized protein n=1 Tax=Pandoraea anhela TaxID=2508295 RepID=A0A5E4X6X5_9BURK|nr:hypothetical protein PAN31108_03675 [Pandoraea anhela]
MGNRGRLGVAGGTGFGKRHDKFASRTSLNAAWMSRSWDRSLRQAQMTTTMTPYHRKSILFFPAIAS